MTDSLATVERCATVAQPSLADLTTACTEMDGEVLGEYIERNWNLVAGNALGLMFLVKEMKRKFKNLDRKKQLNGEYLTIRGCRSFKEWFNFTGKSQRMAYYLLETEEKKNERNAGRRSEKKEKKDKPADSFAARITETKKKLADLHRQMESNCTQERQEREALEKQVSTTVWAVVEEFLATVAPDGYEVVQGDNGKWYLTKKKDDQPTKKKSKAVHALNESGNLICRPGKKPKPTQLVSGDAMQVTCCSCVLRQ
jgi:hypothetical protein